MNEGALNRRKILLGGARLAADVAVMISRHRVSIHAIW
jgi:hypothetical protein